jgi:hypothetical protein
MGGNKRCETPASPLRQEAAATSVCETPTTEESRSGRGYYPLIGASNQQQSCNACLPPEGFELTTMPSMCQLGVNFPPPGATSSVVPAPEDPVLPAPLPDNHFGALDSDESLAGQLIRDGLGLGQGQLIEHDDRKVRN